MCWREKPKQRKEQGHYGHTKCMDHRRKHPTSAMSSSRRGTSGINKNIALLLTLVEKIPIRCNRLGQMSPEFSSSFHKTSRALNCRVSGYLNQSRVKYLLLPAMVTILKMFKKPQRIDVERFSQATVTLGCTSGCGCSSQDEPAGRHTILCSQQKHIPLERVETEKTHDS